MNYLEEIKQQTSCTTNQVGFLNVLDSLDGDELGASGGTDSDFTVANRLVSHGVFSKVVTDHIGPDLDSVPVLSRVYLCDGADHLGHDDAVSKMCLDRCGFLTIGGILDGLG